MFAWSFSHDLIVVNQGAAINEKGIAYLIAKQDKKIRDWNRIEKLARAAGIYKPIELAALIRAPPVRQIGQHNPEICKIIVDEKIKNPKKSLHAIIKDNLKRLMLINGDDFRQLQWGMEWEKLQESKSRKLIVKNSRNIILGITSNK